MKVIAISRFWFRSVARYSRIEGVLNCEFGAPFSLAGRLLGATTMRRTGMLSRYDEYRTLARCGSFFGMSFGRAARHRSIERLELILVVNARDLLLSILCRFWFTVKPMYTQWTSFRLQSPADDSGSFYLHCRCPHTGTPQKAWHLVSCPHAI